MDADSLLFYDDHLHAISEMVDHNRLGLTRKQVAAAMWPSMKPDSAYGRLVHCMKGSSGEKLDLGETKLLARITGRSDALYWLCDETEHSRPMKRAPADRREQLMREFNERVEQLDRIQRELRLVAVAK